MSTNDSQSHEGTATELTDFSQGDSRPGDCDCSPRFDDLPCWPCYRDGFETPNPDVERDD